MKIITQSHEILEDIDSSIILRKIEKAIRVCYKSEDRTTNDLASAKKIIKQIIDSEHYSVLEHHNITVKLITDRGVLAELTRHRLCSYSVESTRYCCYAKEKFGKEITIIKPVWYNEKDTISDLWKEAMETAETFYFSLLNKGWTPQEARSVLPNSLKTEIIMTANLREWRHIFKLRTSKKAHPQIRSLMIDLLNDFKNKIPIIFNDVIVDENN